MDVILACERPTKSQLRSVGRTTFFHHSADVNSYGSLSHAEPTTNQFVAFSHAEMLKDVALPGCEVHGLTPHTIKCARWTVTVRPILPVSEFGVTGSSTS